VENAVIAQSETEAHKIWALRDDVGQVMQHWPVFVFDVSLQISDMEAYVAAVRGDLTARWPAAKMIVFGHLGDGNLHVVAGVGDAGARHAVEEIVYEKLSHIGGSISAEHGIGLQKREYLRYSRSPAEMAVMRAVKKALDPHNILNRGKILETN